MNRAAYGMALMLTLSALAGCGSPSSSDQAAANASGAATGGAAQVAAADPCALVTKEEVAAVTGGTFVAVKGEGDSCTYEGDDAGASSVTIRVLRKGAVEEIESVRAAAAFLGDLGGKMAGQEGAPGDVGKMLSGGGAPGTLGDESLFDANQHLHVRKGDVYLAVAPPIMRSRMAGGNPLLSGQQKRDMATAIAQKALAKL